MKHKRSNIPRKLKMGKVNKPQDRAPLLGGGGGKIDTQWQDIKWTPKKLAIAFAVLGIPFLVVMVLIFKSGSSFIGLVFVGMAIFMGLMYLALRFIDNNEF